jgi:hypothetical protein
MTSNRFLPALSILLALGAPAFGQSVQKYTFDENEGGWTVFGQGGSVAVTTAAADVKAGKGALKYAYNVQKGDISFALVPTPGGALAKAKSVKFWVRTSETTPVFLILAEAGGGRYAAGVSCSKGQWNRVEIPVTDFGLMEGNDDPKDPNGKLDLDQVENAGFFDFGQFFAQADEALAGLLGIQQGPRTMLLDEFEVSEEAAPSSYASAAGEFTVDTFATPHLAWFGVGGAELAKGTGAPLAGTSLKVVYRQAPGKLSAFARQLPGAKLAGMKKLTFAAASAKPTSVVVQLEEHGGGKYNAVVALDGASTPQSVSLSLSDFSPADDSKDANDKLDIAEVRQIVFIDLAGIMGGVDQDNTVWVNKIKFTAG